MNTKPEALRLADWLEDEYGSAEAWDAANELRRLHLVNAELLKAAEDAINQITCQLKLLRCHDEFVAHETQKLRQAVAKAQE
jgi:hypothetical protein